VTRSLNGPIPGRIARLPVDRRGYPIPFFVAYENGEPYFPAMDPVRFRDAVKRSLCWICGEPLGVYKAFAIGPMCCVNRVSAEPPQHADCAKFAAANCPFMTQPLAKRAALPPGSKAPAGIMIERNPGVMAIWVTKSFSIIDAGGMLFRLGPATSVEFWARGRQACRAEVDHSVATGLPILQRQAALDGPAGNKELDMHIGAFTALLDGLQWPAPTGTDDSKNFGNPDFEEVVQ
jgi:hypothetical protein